MFPKYYQVDHIKNDNMGGTCSTDSGTEEICIEFCQGQMMEREYQEDIGVEGKITLKVI